jgi:hypothetical protein
MDKIDKIGLSIIIIILTIWLAAAQNAIETLRKDVKEIRADVEELYLRSEK